MKRHRHIFGIMAVLIFIISSATPVPAVDDAAAIDAVIRAYYDSFVREDLDGFLNTQALASGEDRETVALMTRNSWSAVGTKDMHIGPVEIALSAGNLTAVVRYKASGTILNKVSGESFAKEMRYIALLDKQNGVWKIERVTPEALFMDEVKTTYERYVASQLLDKNDEGDGAGQTDKPPFFEDLMLCYDFVGDLSAETVADLSAHENKGIVHGAVSSGSAGLFFDGVDDYVEVPVVASLHTEEAITIVGDITPWGYEDKPWRNVIWKGGSPDGASNLDHREYGVWINSGGFFHFASTPKDRVGTGQLDLNTPVGLVQGRTIFACVIDSPQNVMKIYVNGKKVAQRTYSKAGIRDTSSALSIGGAPAAKNDDFYFKGYIKSISLYARAFSDEEIARVSDVPVLPAGPLENVYRPAEIVARGRWADVSRLTRAKGFAEKDLKTMERGVDIEDGLFCHPGAAGPTEIVYLHDGSPLQFSGQVAVLDCIDYCGQRGAVSFAVETDGEKRWQSEMVKQKDPALAFDVDLTGVRQIRLVTADGGNGQAEDWAAWLNLKIAVPANKPGPAPATVSPAEAPAGETGAIDHIYTLIDRPSGVGITSISNFCSSVDQIYVWFIYSDLEPGTVLKGVWLDAGRTVTLQEFPVIITHSDGDAGFLIRRPLDGWIFGKYRVDIMSGESTIGTAGFEITK